MDSGTAPASLPPRLGRGVWLWALGVLVSGLGFTAWATLWVWQDGRERDRERFTRLAEAEWAALETRIEADEHVLKGLAGYFDERATVDTNHWRHQLELINPGSTIPNWRRSGLRSKAIGIGNRWRRRTSWRARWRGGREEPERTNLVYFPVLYSWRPDRWPRRAHGEGFFTDEILGRTFPRSHPTLQPAMTPPYPLWRDAQGQPVRGVTLMLATFLPRMLTGDVAAPNTGWPDDFGFPVNVRRSSVISGVVFLSWRMGDLFRTVFGEEPREVVLEIFDGAEPLEERRWNTFPPKWLGPVAVHVRKRTTGADASTDPPPHVGGYQPAFTTDLLKPNYGEKVLVRAHSTPWFDRQSQRGRAWLAAGAGSLLSMALAGLVFVQTRGRVRAEVLSGELAESRELLRRAAAERERLSRDLHDGTVQSLYAVGLGLGRVRRGLGGSAWRSAAS